MMQRSTSSMSPRYLNPQEPYTRARDNPFFDGMRRGGGPAVIDNKNTLDVQSKIPQNISRSPSNIVHSHKRHFFQRTLFPAIQSDSEIDLKNGGAVLGSVDIPPHESAQESHFRDILLVKPAIENLYCVNKRTSFSGISLPPSAASFYNGHSPNMEVVELSESVNRLNLYLKARKDDVNAGIPGKFLRAVIGQDLPDVGSVASTIMYAFYLNETRKCSSLCTVPVINMKRADLDNHNEIKWLLVSCRIDQSSMIFIDEIDLSYYDLFGSLKLVLNGDKLPTKLEVLKEALVEIFNFQQGDPAYPWVQNITLKEGCSSCAHVAEKIATTSPEILSAQGFSRLLLAGILMDTSNLTNLQCTTKDKYMATLLINGAGRFGLDGLYQILRYKMYDLSNLSIGDILRKDFKKWTRVGKPDGIDSRRTMSQIWMSSIGLSIGQLLAHADSSVQQIAYFQQMERIGLLVIVSGYYDCERNFKREILISAEYMEQLKEMLHFLNSKSSQLPLKHHHLLPGGGGLLLCDKKIKVFEVDKLVSSRKTIERLLEEFSGTDLH
ncbi:exopolyphosphatase PRUNE1-like [Impatiens glandulifera]|uniref:exopolyphosphatase PRUNE1-like n=1 Tax=Impatiens glandulifera TaxID=253017 RepID=UPI001FB0C3A2|nr:exopolyphosphatase PRUNE1-like [Impatiens glandulifera]